MDHDLFKELVQKEVKRIEAELIEFAKYMRELKVSGEVKSTHAHKPGEGVISTADKEKASLIITGSRGLGKIRRTFLGSCSDYILHHASCPVLVCTGEHHLTEK
ncbi:hypothetical protein FSP39_021522 [Pinctada imbricata]|uniref:UspA domain-containing protein n=1 Tax=Pinctada imbricata TaxID=66713 RepID=A0AA89CBF7_PINIB|nr:hypothetical protein FSP39_021522 [Pinctada imbricata]